MAKKLSEMSLEELWQLFPIVLTEHQSVWKSWYEAEAQRLSAALGDENIARISHIGSTAVPNIWAKPIIDILAELRTGVGMEGAQEILGRCGYRCMSQDAVRASFNRGYTEEGFAQQVFHLHLRCAGDHDELYFRDYLLAHPSAAKEYERLKLSLWKRYEHDRDGYTAAKSDFVRTCTQAAKLEYPERY